MSESVRKPLVIFTYLVLIASTLLVYLQVGNFDFVNYDDDKYVAENPHVFQDGIIWAFTTSHASNWHPVTWLSHMLDCRLFGLKPGPMHLVNVLLHLANTLLLFTVLKKMTGSLWPSAFVAAAFALHPMHVESVAWIAERKDVLSTFFLLLALAAYISYVKRPSVFRYIASLVLFAFGLMAKPMLVTLPLLLLLLDYWPLNRFDAQSRYRIVIEKIPFFALAVVSSVITFMVQQTGGAVINAIPLRDRVANAFLSYAQYIWRMLWPQDLAVFYPINAGSLTSWHVATSILLLVVISILVIWLGRRRKYLPVGWFWFVVALVPVIGLVQIGRHAFADRYTYIPYIGLFIVIAWGLPELLSKWQYRKIALGLSGVVVLTALGICAHKQVSYWNNSITLFSHAIEVTQNNYLAHYNRADAYARLGAWQKSMDDYREAISIKPDYAEAYNNRGVSYGKLGRWQEAIVDFNKAIDIRPDYAEAYKNRGAADIALGRDDEAIDDYEQAIKLMPDYADARYDLASRLAMQGRCDEALVQYHAALKLRPDWTNCMNDLALLIATGPDIRDRNTDEAISLATRASVSANNRSPVLLGTLAAAQASAGRFAEAVDTAKRAISLADAANQPQISSGIKYHLSFYTQGRPFIEPPPKPLPGSSKP